MDNIVDTKSNGQTVDRKGKRLNAVERKVAARASAQGLQLLKEPNFGSLSHTLEGFVLMRPNGHTLMTGIPTLEEVEHVLDEVRPHHRKYAIEYVQSRVVDHEMDCGQPPTNEELECLIIGLLENLERGIGRDAELIALAMRLELGIPPSPPPAAFWCDLTESFWKRPSYGADYFIYISDAVIAAVKKLCEAAATGE